MTKSTLEEFLRSAALPDILQQLGAENVDFLVKEITHFTGKEAERRDKIVQGYFGKAGINRIVDSIVTRLNSSPKLQPTANILDAGAGSGFFTVKVASKFKAILPKATFFAMDATPAMLLALEKKRAGIIPFFGIAENIQGSIKAARNYGVLPERFDALFSMLMLHHCPDINKVFISLRQVLQASGKAVIVDMCTHPFAEFREEMGDVHLGFDPDQIEKAAQKVFSRVTVEKLPGICCQDSGRSAELFIATLKP
jgi:SAM-dependent methyltransferase